MALPNNDVKNSNTWLKIAIDVGQVKSRKWWHQMDMKQSLLRIFVHRMEAEFGRFETLPPEVQCVRAGDESIGKKI